MSDRAVIIGRLEAEARQAEGCFEYDRAAELRAQAARMSQGSAASPAQETTAARRPARSKR
jgi:hypothetical protein